MTAGGMHAGSLPFLIATLDAAGRTLLRRVVTHARMI
jgi:hypothetical protein